MKKIFTFVAMAALFFVGVNAEAYSYDGIYAKQQIVYSPSTKTWNVGGMAPDRIVLTKKTSTGSGSYSEYYDGKGKLVFNLGSNFEIIEEGRLIAIHNADLKYFEVTYKDGKFSEKELSKNEVQKLFPEAQVIETSKFDKHDELKITKLPFMKKEILLYNDMRNSFYKYSYKPETVKMGDITGHIQLVKYGNVVFSHYGDNTKTAPIYLIKVRPL